MNRVDREIRTLELMVKMYCRQHHGKAALCEQCEKLRDYAADKTRRCRLLPAKPVCSECTVHCYKAAVREEIRTVMRYAGPRMLWIHPVYALWHIADRIGARRKSKEL